VFYEVIVRLFGADILWAIGFLSCTLGYKDATFTVSAGLRQPVTPKIQRLVKGGLKFRVRHDLNVIINERYSYHRSVERTLAWENGWRIEGKPVDEKDLQNGMGSTVHAFTGFQFNENDDIVVSVTATILPDEGFSASTGLETRVLWNYYTPSIKNEFIFKNRTFELQ
jgi:hypothetical protein